MQRLQAPGEGIKIDEVFFRGHKASGVELLAEALQLAHIAGGKQHNIEIALQAAMLETIVEQMKLRTEHLLGKLAGEEAVFAYNHRYLERASDQQRLVAVFGGTSLGVHYQAAAGAAAI